MGDIADVDERESRYTPEPWGCVKIGSFFFSHLIRSKFFVSFFLFPTAAKDEVTFVFGLFSLASLILLCFGLSVPVHPTLPFQNFEFFLKIAVGIESSYMCGFIYNWKRKADREGKFPVITTTDRV